MDKADQAYKTIGEVAKILDLKVNKKGSLPTHIISCLLYTSPSPRD